MRRAALTILILVSLLTLFIYATNGETKPADQSTQEKEKVESVKRHKEDEEATKLLNAYLKDFSMTSWYDDMKEVTVSRGVVTIKTDIYPDDEGKVFAEKLTAAPFGFANANDSTVEIKSVWVLDQFGNLLLVKDNPLY